MYAEAYKRYQNLFDAAERIDFTKYPEEYEAAHADANAAYWVWHNLYYHGSEFDY